MRKENNNNNNKSTPTLGHQGQFESRFASDYEPVRRLGAGGFGIVLEARDKLVGINYAVKRIPLSSSAEDKAKVLREVRNHARLSHQHIVRYHVTWLEAPPPGWQAAEDLVLAKKVGVSIHDPGWTTTYSDMTGGGGSASGLTKKEEPVEFLYIVMELCQHGTLKEWMEKNQSRPLAVVIRLFRQLCNGVDYIHRQRLIHRDLKPSNIYLTENNCIKIGDFGLATAELGAVAPPARMLHLPAAAAMGSLTNLVGTKLYMSPEQRRCLKYDRKVDIYSLGLILLDLLTPFATDAERYGVLTKAKETLELPSLLTTSEDLKHFQSLLILMLHHIPKFRPEAKDILRLSPKTLKPKTARYISSRIFYGEGGGWRRGVR
jgi:serine/threonine protein kinase